MLEKLINSEQGKSFRKSFLKRIHNDISTYKRDYCCHVHSWHSWFICWRKLKEVQENLHTTTTLNPYNDIKPINYTCGLVWFRNRLNRLEFLQQCLNKFN